MTEADYGLGHRFVHRHFLESTLLKRLFLKPCDHASQ